LIKSVSVGNQGEKIIKVFHQILKTSKFALCLGFCAATPRPPVRPSAGFIKPSSDDEDSGPKGSGVLAWKKSSASAHEPDSFEEPQQENKKEAEKTRTAPQASVSTRSETLHFVVLTFCD